MNPEQRIRLKLDTMFFRDIELGLCKTEAQKDKLKDRWAIQDAAQAIADAISSRPSRTGFLFF